MTPADRETTIGSMRSVPLFLVALTAAGSAQSPAVDPPAFRWIPAPRETGWPFGHPQRTTLRYLEIHDRLAGTPRTIRGLALRRHAARTAAVPAFAAELECRLGTATRPAARIEARFARNLGPDTRLVTRRRRVAFPASRGPFGPIAPFIFLLPVDTPFAFAGKGSLAFELVVYGHDNRTPFTFDLFESERSLTATVGRVCKGARLASTIAGGRAVHRASGLPADAPTVFLAGIELDRLGSRRLPLDLGPLGAPGCDLVMAPAVQLAGFATGSGTLLVEAPVDRLPPGVFYAVQVAAVRPGLNPLGVVTTNGEVVLPKSARGAARVWAEASTAERGLAQPVWALVLEVR